MKTLWSDQSLYQTQPRAIDCAPRFSDGSQLLSASLSLLR